MARNFQPKSQILKLLDLMSIYKLNVFHFNLANDEGWRLQIPGLPELTEFGSKRGFSEDESDFCGLIIPRELILKKSSWIWVLYSFGFSANFGICQRTQH